MSRQPIDLSAHINETVVQGHAADFPVSLQPVFCSRNGSFEAVPHRVAVVREDTGVPVAVVSDRYRLVTHREILETVEEVIRSLDVGSVPRGVYVDRGGARMRALFKFPELARPVRSSDEICPCLKIQNTYDGTSRISVHIGAFRFVCTNLAIGGGGVFAGGFMSIHTGEIPIAKVGEQLAAYLEGFEAIIGLYQYWWDLSYRRETMMELLTTLSRRAGNAILDAIETNPSRTVYAAYNVATRYATHEARSYRTAFEMLERINRGFQECFPLPTA